MDEHGAAHSQSLLPMFEEYLDKGNVVDEGHYDRVREGAVVFLGTLARHLDPRDAKVRVLESHKRSPKA